MGSSRVRAVVAAADSRAANPFESVLRALCIEAGLSVVPQQPLPLNGVVFHPDLTCADLGLLIEADSFTFHSGRQAFKLDCERYNHYTLADWRLLRFTYEQVVGGQDDVRRVLARAARLSRT